MVRETLYTWLWLFMGEVKWTAPVINQLKQRAFNRQSAIYGDNGWSVFYFEVTI